MLPSNTGLFLALLFSILLKDINAQERLNLKYGQSNVYAGIEVGSKGVKLSILEIGKGGQRAGALNLVKDTSINSDFIAFTKPTFSATLNALENLYSIPKKRYGIPPDRIFTLFSSGVKGQADKGGKESWLLTMRDSFRIRINEPLRNMEAIDVSEEARLSHLGIVPETRRYTSFLIDIGSGNTKGGYFPNGNTRDFKLFELTWGTKSIANSTEKRLGNDLSLSNYKKQLEKVLSTQPEEEIVLAVNMSGAYNMSDYIAFSGGIAWATSTLLFPGLLDNTVVPVTYDEVVTFSERIFSDFNSLSPDALARTSVNSNEKNKIARETRRVHNVFDRQALLAGTGLLLKIMRQFEGVVEKKQFYLIKNGQVGWISAYVDQSLILSSNP